MSRRRTTRRELGFNLIELLIVLAIVGMLALFGMPALLAMLERARLQNGAREAAGLLRQARLEAVKRSGVAGVTVDYQTNQFIAFTDLDSSGTLTPADQEIGRVRLPTGVELWGPGDADGGGGNANSGFPENAELEGTALFNSVGAARAAGGFRIKGDGENYLEVRVEPVATGRVALQKWFGGDPNLNWFEQGEDGVDWEWYDEGEVPVPPP